MPSEPEVVRATIRETIADEIPIECRFSDGQKFAAITVDTAFPDLAVLIATALSISPAARATYADVYSERVKQDLEWGGDAHDDLHELNEWLSYIDKQRRYASWEYQQAKPARILRERFVKIAALAVAAIESIDRKAERERGDAH